MEQWERIPIVQSGAESALRSIAPFVMEANFLEGETSSSHRWYPADTEWPHQNGISLSRVGYQSKMIRPGNSIRCGASKTCKFGCLGEYLSNLIRLQTSAFHTQVHRGDWLGLFERKAFYDGLYRGRLDITM